MITLRQLLSRIGNRAELARTVGVTRCTVTQWAQGIRRPSIKLANKIAESRKMNLDIDHYLDCGEIRFIKPGEDA